MSHRSRYSHHSHQSSSYGYAANSNNYYPFRRFSYGQQNLPTRNRPTPHPQQGPHHGAQGYGQQVTPYQQPSGYGGNPGQELQYLQAEGHRLRQNEHRAEMGAPGAVAFAAYEDHEEEVYPAHAHRHHVEAQVAGAAALGQGGYALYEHHGANKLRKQESHLGGPPSRTSLWTPSWPSSSFR